MKGLNFKKLSLALAVSAASAGASAEIAMLDDAELQDVTGQAGLTIDVETQWEMGEFAYHDAGYLLIQGVRLGGNSMGNGTGSGGQMLDNLRLEVDIAGDGTNGDNQLAYGFSNMRDLAQLYIDKGNTADVATFTEVAGGLDSARGNLSIDNEKVYGDGDLVIHFDFTDGWHSEGGYEAYDAADRFINDDYHTAELIFEHAVDFRMEIDAIGLADSNYTVGSKGLDTTAHDGIDTSSPGTTTLISQLGIQGYLGPEDLHIENNGNDFGAVDTDGNGDLSDAEIAATSTGRGDANSKITWGTYFKITDLDVYIDIAGVQISDMRIHNERGDRTGIDGTSSFDFAHSIREIYAVKDAVLNYDTLAINGGTTTGNNIEGYVDGIAINTTFKGDIDIEHLSFGDTGQSIGQIYITDLYSVTNWTISAHD